jgi:hypothetical protein
MDSPPTRALLVRNNINGERTTNGGYVHFCGKQDPLVSKMGLQRCSVDACRVLPLQSRRENLNSNSLKGASGIPRM